MTFDIAIGPARAFLIETLNDIPSVEAAALYGSVARGDVEPHSDIDLLVLCQPGKKKMVLRTAGAALSREFKRLSLALYSHQELQFLDRARSLFLLHLKREADVLLDRSGFLGALLREFHAKPSYRSDFVDSLSLLDALRTRVAHSPNDLHRLSYAYSLFRVFGVYLLAERGIYEFSKSKMAACLTVEYPSARPAIATLSGLRVLNANFFSGGAPSSMPQWLGADEALAAHASALSQLTETPLPVLERPYNQAVAEFGAAVGYSQRLNYRLRTWFLLLAYDGLNLYCKRCGEEPLISFDPQSLQAILAWHPPEMVATTAELTLECIRSYRLKYFLNEDAKISAARATEALDALASGVRF